jgi:hypothetical protein
LIFSTGRKQRQKVDVPIMSSMQTLRRLLMAALLLCNVLPAMADRTFPDGVQRGVFKTSALPDLVIDDKLLTITPSLRIYKENSLIVMPASLAGQSSRVVNYLLNDYGVVQKIWLLSDSEAALPAPVPRRKVQN